MVGEYKHLYPEKVRPDFANITPAGFDLEVMADEPEQLKVAQTPLVPAKTRSSDRKKEKKPIDNGAEQPYSDIRDPLKGLNDTEKAIANLLLQGERLVDDVIAESGLSAASVLASLTVMEIKGIVKRMPGKRVALK